ncbi:phosphopantetheine-binding protein [Saccharothrix variisporea]|uniref:Diaminopimelate decarboxylase n=1 Tax=Saccharothrix variisporea TaxID=543527 RepID=A0A495XJI4_9PSEU|nr:phosphopantetheine-binding protein [Saccharothrix variisporea]RKT74681.1 diaminopimelate decarboxylase [Saccharothrix variisporea]
MSELHVQGIPVSAIAEEFGTPLYLYDADVLADTYTALRDRLHPAVEVYFSLKANPNVSVCAELVRLGAGTEVSSAIELATASLAGSRPEHTIFLGPGKTDGELRACVDAGIRTTVVESAGELRRLDAIVDGRGGAPVDVLLRVNPAFTTKGSGLSMGGKPRQFGIDEQDVPSVVALARTLPHVRVAGLHAYMGTRILNATDIVHNTRGILDMAAGLHDSSGVPLDTVDIGGGLGVAYFDNEKDLDLDAVTAGVNAVVEEFLADHPDTRLIMELGRYLVAFAGRYVVRVLDVKTSRGEAFAIADGGTNHHMAAVGIGSFVKRNFPIRSLTRFDEPATGPCTVTGPLCTPNDVIGKKVPLAPVAVGDLLGVERSGAYGPTASPVQFLSHGYPAEVLVRDGQAHLVRRRDTAEDLLGKQILLPVRSADRREDPMNRDETIEAVKVALADVLQRELPATHEDTRLFEDLHLDSTSVLEVLMTLEDSVGIEVDPEELQPEHLKTIGSLADYALDQAGERARG